MGKLIKNHWARLIIMTAAACTFLPALLLLPCTPLDVGTNGAWRPPADQVAAALECYFWPKFFFDFLTKNFDGCVKPVPILQTVNLVLGFISLAYEWPLHYVAGTTLHKSFEARMLWLPLCSLASMLMYQGTNPALYYLIGCSVYLWAYGEGEVRRSPWAPPPVSSPCGVLTARGHLDDLRGAVDLTQARR